MHRWGRRSRVIPCETAPWSVPGAGRAAAASERSAGRRRGRGRAGRGLPQPGVAGGGGRGGCSPLCRRRPPSPGGQGIPPRKGTSGAGGRSPRAAPAGRFRSLPRVFPAALPAGTGAGRLLRRRRRRRPRPRGEARSRGPAPQGPPGRAGPAAPPRSRRLRRGLRSPRARRASQRTRGGGGGRGPAAAKAGLLPAGGKPAEDRRTGRAVSSDLSLASQVRPCGMAPREAEGSGRRSCCSGRCERVASAREAAGRCGPGGRSPSLPQAAAGR